MVTIRVSKIFHSAQALPVLRICKVSEKLIKMDAVRQLAQPGLQTFTAGITGNASARCDVHQWMRGGSCEGLRAGVPRPDEGAAALSG